MSAALSALLLLSTTVSPRSMSALIVKFKQDGCTPKKKTKKGLKPIKYLLKFQYANMAQLYCRNEQELQIFGQSVCSPLTLGQFPPHNFCLLDISLFLALFSVNLGDGGNPTDQQFVRHPEQLICHQLHHFLLMFTLASRLHHVCTT